MDGRLIDIVTGDLLEKFGAGNHKPGSGSASALQGMVSVQMLRTVIDLTDEPKRRKAYSEYLPELRRIKLEIELRIDVELKNLFQEDSEQFDEVIQLRIRRNEEGDPLEKRRLSQKAQEALKMATLIPLKIAELCLELGDFAAFVFDYGFKAARGDSGVGLHSAISGVASCLFIVELNLTSLPADEWMEVVRQRKTKIKLQYERLCKIGAIRLNVLEKESEENYLFQQSFADFRRGNLASSTLSNLEIEEIARRLQNKLWLHRAKLWKDVPARPEEVLKPSVVLSKIMNYTYLQLNTLGTYIVGEDRYEVAGLIDKNERLVQVSERFPHETQNFTAAHELGHAILHKQIVLHRDRPIDGSISTAKSQEEIEADKFATYFLMPAKGVRDVFGNYFNTQKFAINQSTVVALNAGSVTGLRMKCQNIRGLSRYLATAELYEGRRFNCLAKLFGVSTETMAIRLEELDLLEF